MRTEEQIREKFEPYEKLMWSGNNLTDYGQGFYFALKYVLNDKKEEKNDN